MLCHNMLAQGEQLMAVSCESNWLQPAWFACMGCRYLIFELDNVQHLLQYCLGHRVCMVMFIPTAHWLVGVASTGKRLAWVGVELWPQSGAKISIDFQRKGWNLSKSLSYSGYSVFAGELSLPEPVSIHILGFWSTQARIRRSLSLYYLDLFGLYRRGDASQAKLRHEVSQRVTSPIFCSVFVNSLDMLTHWQIKSQVVPQKTIHWKKRSFRRLRLFSMQIACLYLATAVQTKIQTNILQYVLESQVAPQALHTACFHMVQRFHFKSCQVSMLFSRLFMHLPAQTVRKIRKHMPWRAMTCDDLLGCKQFSQAGRCHDCNVI